jgi:hypothetical protein
LVPAQQALPLDPGEEFTLTTRGDYYRWSEEGIAWPLPQGVTVYAQVDSLNPATTYGLVKETHEIVGGWYNNVSEAVKVAGLAGAPACGVPGEGQPPEGDMGETSLPPRP